MTASVYGTSVGGGHSTTIASETTRFGTIPVIRQFTSGMPGSLASGLTTSQVLFYSFKCVATNYTGMAAGTWDSAIQTWLRGLPSGQTVYACYYHEPENDGFTLAQWRAAADHFNNLVHTTTGVVANVFATQIYMYGTLMGWNGRNINNYWPTTHTPDHIGFDFDGISPGSGSYPDLTTGVNAAQSFAAGKGIPWSVTEFGSSPANSDTSHAARATWNTTEANLFSAHGAQYVIYWDDGDVYLSQSNEITAWANLVASTPSSPPAAPTGLSVTPATNGTTATVTWTGPTSGVDHWDAYIQGPGQTFPHKLNTSGPIAVTPRSYTFPTTPGTTYSPGVALVSAADSAGTVRSGYSSFVVVNAPNPGGGGHYPVITTAVPTQDGTNPLLYHCAATATDIDGGTLTYQWTFTYPADTTVPAVTLNTASGDVTLTNNGSWNWTLAVTDPTNLTTTQTGTVTTTTGSANYTSFVNARILQHGEDVRNMAFVDADAKPKFDSAIQTLYFRKSAHNAKYALAGSSFNPDDMSGSNTLQLGAGQIYWGAFILEDIQLTQLLFASLTTAQTGTGVMVSLHDSTGTLLPEFGNAGASGGISADSVFQGTPGNLVLQLGFQVQRQNWGDLLFWQMSVPPSGVTSAALRVGTAPGLNAKIGLQPLWGSGTYTTLQNPIPFSGWTSQNQIWVGAQ